MGGDPRRPHVQHQNRFAFKHNKASRKTAKILALPNEGLCNKCHDIIEWRKRFRKYKPLTTPRRCQMCDQKKVTRAYHNICDTCAASSDTCAKCREHKSIVNPIITPEQEKADIELVRDALGRMSERERRTFFRHINANKPDDDVVDEEENYWAPEEEIDYVKAAKYLRNLEALKLEKANKEDGDNDEDDDEDDDNEEGEGESVKKGDSKQTNSDPNNKGEKEKEKEKEKENNEEEEEDFDDEDGEDDEDQE